MGHSPKYVLPVYFNKLADANVRWQAVSKIKAMWIQKLYNGGSEGVW